MKVPVYITNKNRVTPMRKLVSWCLAHPDIGQVTVLDNGSTYPPLLEYYEEIKADVSVEFLGEQAALCWVFWEQHREDQQTGPYIVTDGDYFPSDDCPQDVIQQMVRLLDRYYGHGIFKVGPGLRLDNVPESPWKNEVMTGQLPYWQRRVPGEPAFFTSIDTHFAVYRKEFGDSSSGAIRLDTPYLFEHYPWYTWPLDDEQRYYSAHDNYGAGHTANLRRKGLL